MVRPAEAHRMRLLLLRGSATVCEEKEAGGNQGIRPLERQHAEPFWVIRRPVGWDSSNPQNASKLTSYHAPSPPLASLHG